MKGDTFAVLDERFLNSPAFAIEQCRTLISQMAEMTRDSFLEAMEVLEVYAQDKADDVIKKENMVDAYIEQCRTLISQMAEMTRDSFLEAMEVLEVYAQDKADDVIKKENMVDAYTDKVGAYLTRLNGEDLSAGDSLKVTTMLHCITDFERISDHAINVVEIAQQMQKEEAGFSKKGKEEVTVYGEAVADILRRTTDAFVQNDQRLAHTVEPLEEVIDELNKVVKKHHMKRLRKGKCTIEMGLMLSDLAMNYERVADHCSNIAVYMMQVKDSQLEEHSFTEQLDAKESEEFVRLLDEFGKKYQL